MSIFTSTQTPPQPLPFSAGSSFSFSADDIEQLEALENCLQVSFKGASIGSLEMDSACRSLRNVLNQIVSNARAELAEAEAND